MTRIKQKVQGMPASDGAGVKLRRVIGQPLLPRLDPFLMLDEFGSDSAQDYIAGFPQHPHRGFQTVTYMLNGKMGHKDSVGNEGVIEDGGLQWMNAGKGIIHEEMPMQTEGKMRGFQLWVNLPSEQKMSEPGYQDIASKDVPEVCFGDNSKVRVLAGEYEGALGAVTTQAVKPLFLDIHMGQKTEMSFDLDDSHNGFIYVYEGNASVGNERMSSGTLGVLDITDKLTVNGTDDAKFILVTGKPINEPIAQYGPFVMNNDMEIQQAIEDYQSGRLA